MRVHQIFFNGNQGQDQSRHEGWASRGTGAAAAAASGETSLYPSEPGWPELGGRAGDKGSEMASVTGVDTARVTDGARSGEMVTGGPWALGAMCTLRLLPLCWSLGERRPLLLLRGKGEKKGGDGI